MSTRTLPYSRRFSMVMALLAGLMTLVVNSAHAGAYDDFFKAIRFDDAGTLARLLNRGFDPNTPSPDLQQPLHLAVIQGSIQSVKALLATGKVEIDTPNKLDETALMLACARGDLEMATLLLSNGAHPLGPGDWDSLHYAAMKGSIPIIQVLLKYRADIDNPSESGLTPLMMAVREGHFDAARVLLKAGADPSPVNQSGFNAAGYAMKAGQKDLAFEIMREEKARKQKRAVQAPSLSEPNSSTATPATP